jgi:hypothetical protein
MDARDRQREVRERVRRVLETLEAEELEERVAPVKCSKHPDSPECTYDYGAPRYAVPDYGAETPDGG